jgi:two-component system, OmpR family, sensor histidine kinase BaeS
MNRIWVGLWLGIMGALVGFGLLFQIAKWLASFFVGEAAVPVWGSLGGVFFATLLAALIAWWLAKPLSEVSRAARQVAAGDLRARARLPQQQGPINQQNTEAIRLLYDFNAMATSLERLESERQATTAAIAHELRTPLAVLQARLAALRDGVFALNLDEVILLAQQTDLLARLVEDLRHLSLADAGKLKLTLAPCDLAALARDAVAGFEPRAKAKGVRLEVCAEEAVLDGDAVRLRQVITNLLDNALKFTPELGCITVTVNTDERGVRLSVQDTGSGIAATVKEKIFERFYHLDSAAGSGLGLAIVKSLVELHGGRVEVSNAVGGGARFEVLLPQRNLGGTI